MNSIIVRIFIITALAVACLLDVAEGQEGVGDWTRRGNKISDTSIEGFGQYVDMSADGTTIIASPFSSQSSTRVLKWNAVSLRWEQLGSDISSGGKATISKDGTTIAIPFAATSVYVFKFDGNDWVRMGPDFPLERSSVNDIALSADGTTISIGYPSFVKAYKFYTSPSRWVQLGTTFGEIASLCDFYYQRRLAMSLDGLTIAVNALVSCDDDTGLDFAQVLVYRYASTQSRWIQLGSSIDGEPMSQVPSGFSVSMSGDGTTVAFGSPLYLVPGIGFNNAASVYKYQTSSSQWIQMGSDILGETGDDGFGSAVALSADGTIVAIGGPFNVGSGLEYSGHVRVYKFSATTSSWSQLGRDIDGVSAFAYAGSTIAISSDGKIVVVGASNIFDAIVDGQVNVYTFQSMVPTTRCNVTWNLYNSQSDQLIGRIRNGTIFNRPPPCNATNIEAILLPSSSCTITPNNNSTVRMKLYSRDMSRLLAARNERLVPYFLFGNSARNIRNGRIVPGTYYLQLTVNGWDSALSRFTLRGDGSC